MRALTSLPALALTLALTHAASAQQVVQIPVDALLDGRPVTTLTNGALVPWTVGVDKDDGFITTAAAAFLKQSGSALPDDGTFPATAAHPAMVLHFSNSAAAASGQAHGVATVTQFEFAVPHASYSALYLAITSSYGDAPLTVTFNYTDASSAPVQFTLPDWGTGQPLPTTPPIFFNLISGLHKWDRNNASVDTPSHSLTGVKLTPAADKQLSAVQISKTTATPFLVFWGATGVASGPVDVGGAGGGAGSAGGTAGSTGGSAGAAPTNTAGAAGSGGVSGMGAASGLGGALSSGAGMASGAGASALAGQGGAVLVAQAGSAGSAQAGDSNHDSGGCALALGELGSARRRPARSLWLLLPCLLLARYRARRGFSSRR